MPSDSCVTIMLNPLALYRETSLKNENRFVIRGLIKYAAVEGAEFEHPAWAIVAARIEGFSDALASAESGDAPPSHAEPLGSLDHRWTRGRLAWRSAGSA